MKKQLSQMSNEELWQLFPILIKEHNPQYKDWYETEKENILKIVGRKNIDRVNHIGSSAVAGLSAKPTIDILLEINSHYSITQLISRLKENEWILMSEQNNPFGLIFNKGYTPAGFAQKVFHLHVRYLGDWNELYFRDFLLVHSDVANEYSDLKKKLAEKFKHNRDSYTEAKSEFILKYSAIAKEEFHHCYKPI